MEGLVAAAGGAAFVAAIAFAAHAAAAVWLPSERVSTRLAGAAVLAYAFAYVLARALLAVGAFGPRAGLAGALGAGALAALGHRSRERLRGDLAAARAALTELSRSLWGIALLAVGGLVAVRVARGLVLPPMGWDAVVYHLFKAGRFVQAGRDAFEAAPDGWGYYEYFPAAGSVFWAWALAFARDGALLAPAGGIVAATIVLGAYAAARRLGAEVATAAAAGLVLVATPAVAAAVTSSYVDNTALALFTLALGFAPWAASTRLHGGAIQACVAGAALGLSLGVRASVLPAVAAFVAAASRRWRAAGAMAVVAVAIALPEYARPWRDHGQPLYPFALSIAGHEIAPGNPQLVTLLSGRSPLHNVDAFPPWTPFAWMFLPKRWPRSDFAGLGPGALAVLALGAWGTWIAVRDRDRRAAAIAIAGAGAVLAAASFSPETVALRTMWASVFSRHVTTVLAAAAVLGALVPARRAWGLWAVALASAVWLGLPRGWGREDLHALADLARGAAPAAIVAMALAWAPGMRRRRAWRVAGAALLLAAAIAWPVPRVRAAWRYPIWKSTLAVERGAYDFHFMDDKAVAAWPMWRMLDGPSPKRIAVTCGWNGISQSWYLYPLMGRELQNTILYVPPTRDGIVVDYADTEALNRRAQLRAWLAHLLEDRIDLVVTLTPSPPERLAWIVHLPAVFVPLWGDETGDNWLYRFDRDRARAMLAAP